MRPARSTFRKALLLPLLLPSVAFCPVALFATGRAVAPEFSLTLKDIRALTSNLPKSIQQRIATRPDAFLHLLAGVMSEPAELFALVDKEHALSAAYVPSDLVSLNGYSVAVPRGDLRLRETIMPAVMAMDAAAKAAGAPLLFSSSYRSYEYQASAFEREVSTYGQAKAEREIARPGMSQHQLGTAIDFGSITDAFADTGPGRWLRAHAWEYGFSLSYPDGYEPVTGYRHESWHYRYITKAGTLLQREFFDDIQQYMLEFLHENRAKLEATLVQKR